MWVTVVLCNAVFRFTLSCYVLKIFAIKLRNRVVEVLIFGTKILGRRTPKLETRIFMGESGTSQGILVITSNFNLENLPGHTYPWREKRWQARVIL